jgi:hypothetical protein
MDILNWLYLVKNNFVRTTPSSENDLLVLGAKVGFNKRGDKYQNYALSIGDLATSTASTLGVESGTYVPTISGATISAIKGFYTKIGDIVQVTVFFQFTGGTTGKDFRISIPKEYDPIGGGGFTNADQASGLIMRYDGNPAASVTENKLSAFVGSDNVRLQYNGGDNADAISCTFTYEVLPL